MKLIDDLTILITIPIIRNNFFEIKIVFWLMKTKIKFKNLVKFW